MRLSFATLLDRPQLNPWKIAAGICLLSANFANGEDLPRPTPVISFAIPSEIDAPIDPDENAIAIFDDYSWRAFIAINWPAKPEIRGVPDVTKKFGDFSDPGTKVVWGTWKADYELFSPAGTEPTEWSSFDGFTPGRSLPFAGSGHLEVLGSFSGFHDFNQAGKGGPGGHWSLRIIPTCVLKYG